MPDWSIPQLYEEPDNDDSLFVGVGVDDSVIDMTDVDDPEQVEVVGDAVSGGVILDVSGGDVTGVTMSFDDFLEVLEISSPDDLSVSENDPVPSEDIQPLAVEGQDISTTSFTPQQWQLNLAENRPIGWHYVMTRTGTGSNNYILVLGRDIEYTDGLYTYSNCDFYSVYSTGSSSNLRYHYDIHDDWSGTVTSSSYVVYSDLYFDYLGSRSVSYSWLIFAFMALIILFLIFFRGGGKS